MGKLIPADAAAARLGITSGRFRTLCRERRVRGARCIAGRWFVPERFAITPGTRGPKLKTKRVKKWLKHRFSSCQWRYPIGSKQRMRTWPVGVIVLFQILESASIQYPLSMIVKHGRPPSGKQCGDATMARLCKPFSLALRSRFSQILEQIADQCGGIPSMLVSRHRLPISP